MAQLLRAESVRPFSEIRWRSCRQPRKLTVCLRQTIDSTNAVPICCRKAISVGIASPLEPPRQLYVQLVPLLRHSLQSGDPHFTHAGLLLQLSHCPFPSAPN
ncbi:MAG UNVERIFIED_CONTAM: hypothetical protein LVR18_49885 [Planctomycetaceae bacterium]